MIARLGFTYYLFVVCFTCYILNSCKTDVSVVGPYIDTATIYGILHSDTPVQVIRINKSFLGSGDALQFAKVPDSINYGKELKVWLERWKENSRIDSFSLKDSIITTIGNGAFSNQQKIYITRHKIYNSSEYKLFAYNTKNNKLFSSSTPLVGRIKIMSPGISFYNNDGTPCNINFSFHPDSNYYAVKYQIIFRLSYTEMVGNANITKMVDYHFDEFSNGYYDIKTEQDELKGDQIMQVFADEIKHNASETNIKRAINGLYVIVTGYNDVLNTYMLVANDNGVTPDKNHYTNIKNGLGIFASMYVSKNGPYQLDKNSHDQFIKLYPELGFE